MAISYKDAGVSIDDGNDFVKAIKPLAKETFNENVLGDIGSFSGAFAMPQGFKNPVMLAATDGVGTKLRLAIDTQMYDGIGEDLVAMCVNDLICNFATPLFFLDYYASAKLDIKVAKKVIASIVNGCKKANCALIGGETAEMPSMYHGKDFDLAGFAVGMAEKEEIDRRNFVKNGDILLALASSGLHSNGYSLARKVLFEKQRLKFDDKIDGKNIIDILLEPTKIYVQDFLKLKPFINTLAHITGGGLIENLPRIFPKGMGAIIRKHHLKTPEIFYQIGQDVYEDEMYRTFNMGVGLVMAVSPCNVGKVLENSNAFIIGEVVLNEKIVLE
ncbi:phosphoribosylformylglycinamidine cyclo-ligase [Campylobacter volucris]|uniref:Phosphoribosylformylglycinamidine cyclo-ligase n=1 Tax=Campylobacter volucris TaxID=1031542 RepID=A0AAF1D1S4_9BACT|nr:phosphoribosylformylglycinamidine cyclo-ligase [Campylobacter volucris]AJC93403.1 phosphoribosylformylglycinamide cyclo-ligase [Campylobacter volucris LMG 24379]KAB0579614.1 phosphoribosylformylglycinamidine cyclo-ligase [Campylobacter volucris]QBL14202.1 phosphoribosylformylglycinamidine cyclo-ligase [Campylobacter volucris]QEL07616.1 phosphoribosylformylglycinamide cyclo-ligase [Campylobacter volucris]TXK66546.1 phosphoribosylformylglycinamidine cyclo-ligase [Campylobacter volucris]